MNVIVGPRKKPLGPLQVFLLILSVISLAAAVFAGSNVLEYQQAARNIDPFTAIMRGGFIELGLGGFTLLVAVVITPYVAARWRDLSGKLRVALIVGAAIPPVLFVVLFCGGVTGSRSDAYHAGFQKWSRGHVDVPAIQKWAATRSAVEKATPVDPKDWPREILRLDPLEVDQLANGVGITWGYTQEFNSRRQVFVSFSGKSAPETVKWGDTWNEGDPQWHAPDRWRSAGLDLWTSVQ